MNAKTRLQLIDKIALEMESGRDFNSYREQIDQLEKAGMSLDDIDLEVEARRQVLRETKNAEQKVEDLQSDVKQKLDQTEEDVNRRVGTLKRSGLLVALITLILAVAASVLLIQIAFDGGESAPATAPKGKWQIKVVPQPAMPAEDGRQQVIVDALVTHSDDGQPAPDGLPVSFETDNGDGEFSPNPALVRGGFARTLLSASAGVSELPISALVHEDRQPVTIALAIPTSTSTPTEAPPREPTAPATESPTPSPTATPTVSPTPEPIRYSIEITPTWGATNTLDIGYGETGVITLTLTQGEQPVENAQVVVRPQPGDLVEIVSPLADGIMITNASGIISLTVKAIAVGQGTIEFEGTGAEIDPVQFDLKPMISVPPNSRLRSDPSGSENIIRTTQSMERFVLTGKVTKESTIWWQLRFPERVEGVAYVGSGVDNLKFDPSDGDKRVQEVEATPTTPTPTLLPAPTQTPAPQSPPSLEAGPYKLKPESGANEVDVFALGGNDLIVTLPLLETRDRVFELVNPMPGKPGFVQGNLSLWVTEESLESKDGTDRIGSDVGDGKACWVVDNSNPGAQCGQLLRLVVVDKVDEEDDWVRVKLNVWIKTANIGEREL